MVCRGKGVVCRGREWCVWCVGAGSGVCGV